MKVFHNREKNYLLFKWKSFRISLAEIQEMHREILDYAVANNCEILVAETSKTTSALGEDIIQWWRTVWVEKLVESGIKLIITILPRDILAQQSTFDWQNAGFRKTIMFNVLSLEQAENKINEYYKSEEYIEL